MDVHQNSCSKSFQAPDLLRLLFTFVSFVIMKTCQYRPFLWRCKFCFYFCFLILVLVMWRHYLKIKMRMLIIYYQLWHSLMILRGAGNCLQRKSVDPSVEKSISKSCYSVDPSINRNWFAATFLKDTGRNRAWNFSLRQIRITTSVQTVLTLLWRKSLSYRNQSINLQIKSMSWFLCDRDLHQERVIKDSLRYL